MQFIKNYMLYKGPYYPYIYKKYKGNMGFLSTIVKLL